MKNREEIFDVWVDVKKGDGGAGAEMWMYVCAHAACDGTKPAAETTETGGTATLTGVDNIEFWSAGEGTWIIDFVLIDDAPIGNVSVP